MEYRVNEVTFLGEKRTLLGIAPKIGSKAPSFNGIKHDLTNFNSTDLDGTHRVYSVVPSIDTAVCALQTSRFNEMVKDLGDVNVLTISCDTPFALSRYRNAQGIDNLITVSDQINLSFGMKYGMVMGDVRLLARGVFIVDKDNILRYAQVVEDVLSDIDFEAVQQFINEMK